MSVGFQENINKDCNDKELDRCVGCITCDRESYEVKYGKKVYPTDGNLSEWTEWSECLKVVDGVEVQQTDQQRTRSCDNPSPQFGGKSCSGAILQIKSCNSSESEMQEIPENELGNPKESIIMILIFIIVCTGMLGAYYVKSRVDEKDIVGGVFNNTSCSQFVTYPTI
jgi:hypothetical protein